MSYMTDCIELRETQHPVRRATGLMQCEVNEKNPHTSQGFKPNYRVQC